MIQTPPSMRSVVDGLFQQASSDGDDLVGHHVCFDLSCLAWENPLRLPLILELLAAGRLRCTEVRQKLLDNADGCLKEQGGYGLSDLEIRYLGLDRSAEKEDKSGWRMNYDALEKIPVHEWPVEAVQYLRQDAVSPLQIFQMQELERNRLFREIGSDPLPPALEAAKTLLAFVLQMMASRGARVDGERALRLRAECQQVLDANMALLEANGVLSPALPARPYANGSREHISGCKKKGCSCPLRMVAPTKPVFHRSALEKFVLDLDSQLPAEEKMAFQRNDLSDDMKAKGIEQGSIKLDREFLEEYAHIHPLLGEALERSVVGKLVTNDLPKMMWPVGSDTPAEVVFTNYDILKATGRTSSFMGKEPLAPAFSCQQVDPRARGVILPRPGCVVFSIDYSQLELVTAAQTCLDLFGESKLAEIINAGLDAHGWLGAQIAYRMHEGFRQLCDEAGLRTPDQRAEAFFELKKDPDEDVRAFYKTFRTLAKPTGLGYWGGLGPAKFRGIAHKQYGLKISLEEATLLREIWREALPETLRYFRWIDEQEDPRWDDGSREGARFRYVSRLGMIRSNATWCATANGRALQTPGAEGATAGVTFLMAEVLAGEGPLSCRGDLRNPPFWPWFFIHDEAVGEAREELAAELVPLAQSLMVQGLQTAAPDVQARTEAVLMRRWQSKLDPLFDSAGKLIPHNNK